MTSKESFEDSRETDPLNEDESDQVVLPSRRSSIRRWSWVHCTSVVLCVALIIETIVLLNFAWKPRLRDPLLARYSPANSVVQYTTVKHTAQHHSPFVMGSPADLDERWLELYDFGMVGLTAAEAAQLYEPTVASPKDPDTFPAMIQVFHLIHCLNNLRQAIWRDDYPFTLERLPDGRVNRTTNRALHLDHCIDSLREALMCASDVTPISFELKGEDQHAAPKIASVHTCRNFDGIRLWAKSRQIEAWKLGGHYADTAR